jgi:hypothetical protein
MRGIQYAAASRFHRYRLGVLDHPLSRMMTTEGVARSISVIASDAKQSIAHQKESWIASLRSQ